MKKLSLILLLVTVSSLASAQKKYAELEPLSDSLQVTCDIYIPLSDRGFLLTYTPKESRGTLISLLGRKYNEEKDVNKILHQEALKEGFNVLYISTGIPSDLYFDDESLNFAHETIISLIEREKILDNNIFLFGSMAAGHRALKYVEYLHELEAPKVDIKGVVLSESAIDWVRMWYEGQKQARDSLNSIKHFEGNFITFMFDKNLGVTPMEDISKYVDFSPYTYFDAEMKKPKIFKDLAIRAYTFAPTNYWFSANGTGIYDCNFPDMSGIINEQKLIGNEKAELIVFSNDKREEKHDMEVQSNTWNLIDKAELMQWILKNSQIK